MPKLTESDVKELRHKHDAGVPLGELVRLYPVKRVTIRKILRGHIWSDVPGPTVDSLNDGRSTGTTIELQRAIKRAIFSGENYTEIERRFDISIAKICRVARGEIWAGVEVDHD